MTDVDVENEIRSIFRGPMGNNPDFKFVYLQPTGGGSRSLTIPSQSPSFKWVPQQVAKLATQPGMIYILAKDELLLPDDICVNDDTDSGGESSQNQNHTPQSHSITEVPVSCTQLTSFTQQTSATTSQTSSAQPDGYRNFVDLIDVTQLPDISGDESPSELPAISSDQESKEKINKDVIKHVILQHQARAIRSVDDEDFQRVHIRRSCLFSDALRQFSRKTFDVTKMLNVIFVGESGSDEGGPRREFLHLLLKDIFSGFLFTGYPSHVVPRHNIKAVSDNTFYYVGKMVATSIVQAGEVPSCFSRACADYIAYGRVCSPVCLEDIPDQEVIESLVKVQSAQSTEEIQSLMEKEEFSFRFQCGYNKPDFRVTLADKEDMLRSIWLHYVHFQVHAELDQFRKGLFETLQFELLTISYADEVWAMFAASDDFEVTPAYLCDSMEIHYSPNGSNNRTKEETIIYNWNEYVFSLSQADSKVHLRDVMKFICGSSKIPATGFGTTPSIRFTDVDCLPTVSTCDVSVTFPRKMALLEYEDFCEKLNFCVMGSYGFGKV